MSALLIKNLNLIITWKSKYYKKENLSFQGHPHASIMYPRSGQNSSPYEVNIMGGCVNIMGSCVSFQIKNQIWALWRTPNWGLFHQTTANFAKAIFESFKN